MILRKLLTGIVSFQLILAPTFANADNIVSSQRTQVQIDAFLKSSAPTDIPFTEYMESFIQAETKPIQNYDLSQYIGKRMFVGYGLYDKNENFCKYIEQPGLNYNSATDQVETYFTMISNFNNRSYAVSTNQMSYQNCLNLTNKFGGYPVTISSDAENAFISSRFSVSKWLGTSRSDCNTPYYGADSDVQRYFNWSAAETDKNGCSEGKLNISQNRFGTWNKTDGDLSLNYCVMEVDSNDIKRPVKLCAPWWRIQRDYANPDLMSPFNSSIDLNRINQADLPELMTVCTKYDQNATQQYLGGTFRNVSCTQYYDATVAPECLDNIQQPICFVDECKGYIKNACRLVQEVTPYKDYTKTQMMKNGSMVWIKGKDQIRTEIYSCPPSPPSLAKCQEKSQVNVFPKECPNSDCDGYKICINAAKSSTESAQCAIDHPCEKIYPSAELPVLDSNGTLTNLKGKCNDGSMLLFDLNIQNKVNRKCLKYDEENLTKAVTQKCTLTRSYTDHTLDMSITANDIYQNNPNCIRLNNLASARPSSLVTIDYTNNGFAATLVKKAFINGTSENTSYTGNINFYSFVNANAGTDMLGNPTDGHNNTFSIAGTTTTGTQTGPDCSKFSDTWYQRNTNVFTTDGVTFDTSVYSLNQKSDGTSMYIKFLNIPDANTCYNKQLAKNGTSYSYDAPTKICLVYTPVLSGDVFASISGQDPVTFITQNQVSKQTCSDYATCLSGTFDASPYSSSSVSQCTITFSESMTPPDTSGNGLPTIPDNGEECVPTAQHGFFQTQLDGTQDIFSIQEITNSDFGYYSNYSAHPYKNNIVSIDGLEVLPLKEVSMIRDPLVYDSHFVQTAITTKKPNFVAGGMAGVGAFAVGVASLQGTLFAVAALTPGAIVVIVAAVVIAVLATAFFGSIKHLNEESGKWIIYKYVPIQRYIRNIYGYDNRTLDVDSNGLPIVYNGNMYKLIYYSTDWTTGTLETGAFVNNLNNKWILKKQMLQCAGWFSYEIPMGKYETQQVVQYPTCKWYQFNCNKSNMGTDDTMISPFYKRMNNIYLGATNTLTIVVPYTGDYELQAYDVNGHALNDSNITIKENEFNSPNQSTSYYAQVMFGKKMQLASGINEGDTTNACRDSLMVEWGGGISGIYYENDDTGMSNEKGCQKSNDSFVQHQSAKTILIRPLNQSKAYVVDIEKPMPFPNRIFLSTLNKKETRMYRCFEPFGTCDDTQFKTSSGGQ